MKRLSAITGGIAVILMAGCSSDGGLVGQSLTTSAINPTPGASAEAPGAVAKVDPACVALTSRIDALRKEGVVERVEKASAGRSASVTVKRESLAKMTELEKANAEFQAKCSTLTPRAAQAAPAAAQPQAAVAAAQAPAAAPAKP